MAGTSSAARGDASLRSGLGLARAAYQVSPADRMKAAVSSRSLWVSTERQNRGCNLAPREVPS